MFNLNDFDAVLSTDDGWTRKIRGESREWVYSRRVGDGIELYVYSSIHIGTGYARAKGRDAIRVCAVRAGRGYIKATRVNRGATWRHNLAKRMAWVVSEALARLAREEPSMARSATAPTPATATTTATGKATCRRCGQTGLHWQVSARTGRYYLTGSPMRNDFHSRVCGS